jgi:hypothetical protein
LQYRVAHQNRSLPEIHEAVRTFVTADLHQVNDGRAISEIYLSSENSISSETRR